jgi:hypothetical protein
MLNTLFLLQYSFLNGYLLHHFFIKEKASDFLEVMISSLFLSWCLNSLVIYVLARVFEMPFTKVTVALTSLSLSFIILAITFFCHSDRSHVLGTERRNPFPAPTVKGNKKRDSSTSVGMENFKKA